jgi:hypothetical protein
VLCPLPLCIGLIDIARENTSGLQKRKSAAEASPRKRQRLETGTVQRPCLPTPRSRQDLVAREEQAADNHSPASDTTSSSFQSDSFASTPSITQSHGIDSTPSTTPRQSTNSTTSTTESQQSPALNYINYEKFEQPVASEEFIPYITQDARLISTARIPAASFADNEFFFLSNRNDVQGFFANCSRVLRSPSPPQALLVAEDLFHNIEVYFQDSCRKMIFDDYGTLLNSNGAELHNDLCNDFDSYCFTATMFKGRKLYVEFRHALYKAYALVENILRAEHPRTLSCFLEVFIHLIQTGHPEVTLSLSPSLHQEHVRRSHQEGVSLGSNMSASRGT